MKYTIFFLLLFSSVMIKAQVTANAGVDQLICFNDTLKATGNGLNAGDTGSYQWKDLNTNIIISTNSSFNLKITALSTRLFELTVNRFHNKVNYSSKDTFIMTVSPLPTFKFSGISPRCYDDGRLNLTFNTVAIASQGNDTSKKFYNLRYFQKYKNPSWVTGGPVGVAPYIYDFPKFIPNAQVPSTGLRDTICYDYKDNNGCYNYECKPIRLNPNPIVKVNDGVFCQKNGFIGLDQLAIIPSNKVGGIQSWRCIQVPVGSGVNPNGIILESLNTYFMDPGLPGENKKTGDYIVEYCFKNPSTGCHRCDTSTVTVVRLPEIEFGAIPSQCMNGSLLTLDSFVHEKSTKKRILTGNWQCVEFGGSRNLQNSQVSNAINNSVKSQKYFDPKTGSGQYLLRFTDFSSGCPISDSVIINVSGLPIVRITSPDSFCANSGNYQLYSNYPGNDTNGKWSGEFISSNLLNSDLVSLGTAYSKQSKVKYTYTNPITKCTNSDSQYLTLIKRPYFKFIQVVTKNSQYLVSFALIDSNMTMKNFKWSWNYGNGAVANDKYPREILYMDSGKFKALLTINNGICDTKDSITFLLNDKASSVLDLIKLTRIYPNPVQDKLVINSPIDGTVNLIDISGKQLYNGHVISNESKQIDMEFYQSGIYMLSIKNEDASYWVKILKE